MEPKTAADIAVQDEKSNRRSPVIIDLGKKKKQQIRNLTKGRGRLLRDITEITDELAASGEIDAGAQPLIVVVREKSKAGKLNFWRP
jgi:hypothetical protein